MYKGKILQMFRFFCKVQKKKLVNLQGWDVEKVDEAVKGG